MRGENSMTRMHFEALAEAISRLPKEDNSRMEVAGTIARVCKHFNYAFNWQKFIAACEPDDKSEE